MRAIVLVAVLTVGGWAIDTFANEGRLTAGIVADARLQGQAFYYNINRWWSSATGW